MRRLKQSQILELHKCRRRHDWRQGLDWNLTRGLWLFAQRSHPPGKRIVELFRLTRRSASWSPAVLVSVGGSRGSLFSLDLSKHLANLFLWLLATLSTSKSSLHIILPAHHPVSTSFNQQNSAVITCQLSLPPKSHFTEFHLIMQN